MYHKWIAFLLIVSSAHFNPFPIMLATIKLTFYSPKNA